jgi:hypothetical protein
VRLQAVSSTRLLCARGGGQVITISGANFGASNAQVAGSENARSRPELTNSPHTRLHAHTKVFVGDRPCANVTHDAALPHRRLRCKLAAGWAPNQPMLVLQGGRLSAGTTSTQDVTVSFVGCPTGFFQNGSRVECGECPVRACALSARSQTARTAVGAALIARA